MAIDQSDEGNYWKDGRPEARIKLYSGNTINVLFPDIAVIDIVDIAHALSCQGRFSGHTSQFYSVAQHSVNVSTIVKGPLQLTALLHDATEAYLIDMPRPIKRATNMGDRYREIEDNLYHTIAKRFGLLDPIPEEIKTADSVMLTTEMRDLMGGVYGEFTEGQQPLVDFRVKPLPPKNAENLFWNRYWQLTDPAPSTYELPRCA
jgi:hypothetical protein